MDDKEEIVSCLICNKGFCSTLALKNHVKIEHMDVFAEGDPERWMGPVTVVPKPKNNKPQKRSGEDRVQISKEELISSMAPGSLTLFAEKEVEVVIFEDDDDDQRPVKRRKKKKKEKKNKTNTQGCACNDPIEGHVCPSEMKSRNKDSINKQLHCEECGMMMMESKLNDHFKTSHPNIKKAICDLCSEEFLSKTLLKRHIKEHKVENHYTCPECSQKFTAYSQLKKHYLGHKAEKRYWCDICKKTFNVKTDLDMHYLDVHSLVKPYECYLCERTFNQESSLKVHMNAVHKASTTYICKFCSNPFSSIEALTKHENAKHRKPAGNKKKRKEIHSEEEQDT